eukprot:m.46680 g.46680  ORF g.46680 m.46680 type:complete len:233 (-) comp20305_c0_seq1:210-908(-)
MADSQSQLDNIASEFATYEDFLNSQISPVDLYYLEDEELARQLVELGYRGSGEVVKREEFEAKKAAFELARTSKRAPPKRLYSEGLTFTDPFLLALASREEANRNGKQTTIIFIRDRNSKGQEISGYIDFSQRLKDDHMLESVFLKKRKLLPRNTDLSFYNWETQQSKYTPTSSYDVVTDKLPGMFFKNKHDRKVINVDPKGSPGDNTTRTILTCPHYIQVVLYDHITRRKA